MSFWGMSKIGKDAEGNLAELSRWYNDQMKQNLGWGTTAQQKADDLNQWSQQYWQNVANNGLGTIEDVQGAGKQIMPIDEAIAARQALLNKTQAGWDNVDKSGVTMAKVNQGLTDLGAGIGRNFDAQQHTIDQATNTDYTNEDTAHTAVAGGINKTYGDLGAATGKTYGDLADQAGKTYSDLGTAATKTYAGLRDTNAKTFAEEQANLEALKPGGDKQVAQVARSYAPVIAGAQSRLRRSGIDVNSPQAQAVLRSSETARARAMDDAAAAATTNYVNSKNALKTSQLQNELGLGQTQAGLERGYAETGAGLQRGYGETGAGIQRNYAETGGNQTNAEILRHAGASNAINDQNAQLTMANRENSNNQGRDLTQQQIQSALLDKQLQTQDWQTQAGLNQTSADEELNKLNLKNQQWQQGMNWTQAQQQSKNTGAGQVGNLMNTDYANWATAQKLAQGWGQQATQNDQIVRQNESQNAGWGTKLLAGVAGGALNMVVPGAGSLVTGAANGATGGGGTAGGWGTQNAGGWGGSTNTGGGWSGTSSGWNPTAWNPISSVSKGWGSTPQAVNYNWYDPKKTKTNPDGSLSVGTY